MNRMKTCKSNLEIVETNSVVTNLKKILTIGPWARAASGERLDQLLDVMLEKTTIQKHLIAAASETVAGASLAHRLHQANGAGGSMMNSLINFSSHCVVVTNTAIKFSRFIKDVTLCFQTAILSRLSMLQHRYLFGEDISGKWALTILDNGNTRDVPEDAYTLARDPKYVQLGDTIDRLETSKTVETTVGAQVYSQTGLAVYIAWKWADYVFSWKGSELRAVNEGSLGPVIRPGFVRLTDTSLMSLDVFFVTVALQQHQELY